MRRTLNIKVKMSVVLDDDREGIPALGGVMREFMLAASRLPGAAEILPGAKYDIGLDRASMRALRKLDRGKRA